jgi:hypothetical protein
MRSSASRVLPFLPDQTNEPSSLFPMEDEAGRHGRPGRVANASLVEGAYFDGRPQGHMDPEHYRQSAVDVSYRHNRMHSSYDIAQTRKREKQINVRRVPLLAGTH